MSEALLSLMAPKMAPRARSHRTWMLAEREKRGFDKGKHLRTRRDSNPQPSDASMFVKRPLEVLISGR